METFNEGQTKKMLKIQRKCCFVDFRVKQQQRKCFILALE